MRRFLHSTALRWVLLFVAYKLVVVGLAVVGLAIQAKILPLSWGHLVLLLYEWDAKIIIDVAANGYNLTKPNIQILPVFPAFIRLIHVIIPNWHWAGVVTTQLASFFSFFYFYKLMRLDLDEERSRIALVLFALFPTAYFLTAPYMEALFCATSFAAVYYARTKHFLPAALAGFLTAGTRVPGLLLAPALAAYAWACRKEFSRRELLQLAGVIAAVVGGYALYLVTNKAIYGDWFYYKTNLAAGWSVHPSWPFKGAIAAIKAWAGRPADLRISSIVLELGFTAFAFIGLWGSWRRRNFLDFTYVFLSLLMLVSLDFWLSRPRYVLVLYPMFTALAPWVARSVFGLGIYGLASAGLFSIYWSLYLAAQWAH